MSEFGQYLITGIATGASFALVALGFVAIYRVTHVVNFAQGAFAMLGGYIMSSMLDRALPGPLAALCAILIVAAIGTLIGVIAVGKPRLPIIASLMITLGLSVLIEGICLLIWGDIPTTYDGIGTKALSFAHIFILPQQVVVVAAVAIVFPLFQLFFARTYIGKAVTACALNRAGGATRRHQPARDGLPRLWRCGGLRCIVRHPDDADVAAHVQCGHQHRHQRLRGGNCRRADQPGGRGDRQPRPRHCADDDGGLLRSGVPTRRRSARDDRRSDRPPQWPLAPGLRKRELATGQIIAINARRHATRCSGTLG